MVKGAIHPNGSNFRRVARLDVVARVRRLSQQGLLIKRPAWLEWCERVPPMENHNLHLQARTVRNPYPQMVSFLLDKYPDLRFQDCYVDGNDWSSGNDAFRDDHPVMQFVGRQLEIMRTEGVSKKDAFLRTEELFRDRRENLEREQKVMMAMAMDAGLRPMFATGRAYLEAEKARAETAHLDQIRHALRGMTKKAKSQVDEARAPDSKEDAEVLDFGQHDGRTYSDVRQNEPAYCKWVKRQEEATGSLENFARYLRASDAASKMREITSSPKMREVDMERQGLVGRIQAPLDDIEEPTLTAAEGLELLKAAAVDAAVDYDPYNAPVKASEVDDRRDLEGVKEPETTQQVLPQHFTQTPTEDYEGKDFDVFSVKAKRQPDAAAERRADGVGKILDRKLNLESRTLDADFDAEDKGKPERRNRNRKDDDMDDELAPSKKGKAKKGGRS